MCSICAAGPEGKEGQPSEKNAARIVAHFPVLKESSYLHCGAFCRFSLSVLSEGTGMGGSWLFRGRDNIGIIVHTYIEIYTVLVVDKSRVALL